MASRIIFALTITALIAACSQAPDPTCAKLDSVIDKSIQKIALSSANGDMFDKSAMQQSARSAEASNYLQIIHINLNLQSQNKCPARKASIDPLSFESEALACLAAKDEEKAALCDPKKWNGAQK